MAHDISLKKLVEKGVSKSWVGQPKVMLQVAWERGLLDLDRFYLKYFTEKTIRRYGKYNFKHKSITIAYRMLRIFLKRNYSYSLI